MLTRAPNAPASDIRDGTVKWFSSEKGYGFITPSDGGEDVFVHKETLRDHGATHLHPEERVKFRASKTPTGMRAFYIDAIERSVEVNLRLENEKMRAALKPFADLADTFGVAHDDSWRIAGRFQENTDITLGHLRQARAALASSIVQGVSA